MKRSQVLRIKYDGYWVSIYLRDMRSHTNISIVVSKSKRAANDWENNRLNKRTRGLKNREAKRVNFVGLYKAYKLLRDHIPKLKPGTVLTTVHRNERTVLLSLFLRRLGFAYYPQDGLAVFALVVR